MVKQAAKDAKKAEKEEQKRKKAEKAAAKQDLQASKKRKPAQAAGPGPARKKKRKAQAGAQQLLDLLQADLDFARERSHATTGPLVGDDARCADCSQPVAARVRGSCGLRPRGRRDPGLAQLRPLRDAKCTGVAWARRRRLWRSMKRLVQSQARPSLFASEAIKHTGGNISCWH
jgi:hypothetical protein